MGLAVQNPTHASQILPQRIAGKVYRFSRAGNITDRELESIAASIVERGYFLVGEPMLLRVGVLFYRVLIGVDQTAVVHRCPRTALETHSRAGR